MEGKKSLGKCKNNGLGSIREVKKVREGFPDKICIGQVCI